MGIAVVIPCHNQARWIERTIWSILTQSMPPTQVIVVNDGSTDGSAEIVRAFSDRIMLIEQAKSGACAARNAGLARVETPFVCFLDGDDYIEGDFLGGASRALQLEGADVAFSPFQNERSDGSRMTTFHYTSVPTPEEVFVHWLDHYSQPPCSIVWRSDFVRSIGGWDVRVLKNQDGEFVMRAMLACPRITKFEEGSGIYNAHKSLSISKAANSNTLRSEFEAMRRLMALASQTRNYRDLTGFGRKLYIIARGAFQIGDRELGREALKAARNVGLHGHPGSLSHRATASILGLECKTVLANALGGAA